MYWYCISGILLYTSILQYILIPPINILISIGYMGYYIKKAIRHAGSSDTLSFSGVRGNSGCFGVTCGEYKIVITSAAMKNSLTKKQEAFCVAFLKCDNLSDAYRSAYGAGKMKASSIHRQASGIFAKPMVAARIAELKAKVEKKTLIEVSDVVEEWVRIAFADPNDIIQVRRICCRYCYGIGHEYQYTTAIEFNTVLARALSKEDEVLPQNVGGYGFTTEKDPHPGCPQCFGNGNEDVFLRDTRKLKGPARRLYAGVKKTRDGIEVKMRDQDAALTNLAKWLGMLKHKVEIADPKGQPIAPISIAGVDAVTAMQIYQKVMMRKR